MAELGKAPWEMELKASQEEFAKAFELLPMAMSITTFKNPVFIDANNAFLEALGRSRDDVIGRPVVELDLGFKRIQWLSFFKELKAKGIVRNQEFDLKLPSGRAILTAVTAVLVEVEGVQCILTAVNDITWLKLRKEELQTAEHIVEFLPDATLVIDLEGKVIAWNKAAEEMTGIKADQMLGKGNYEYSQPFYGRRQPMMIDLVINPDQRWEGRLLNIERKERVLRGEDFCPQIGSEGAYLRATASPLFDHQGRMVGAIQSIRDATNEKKAEEQMKYLSLKDSLTGVYNRAYFEEEMNRLELKQELGVGIILCDVDGLKLFNDTLGHKIGDRLLSAAAGVIRQCFRDSDTLARVGGDEFSIIMPNCNSSRLEMTRERIQNTIGQYNRENPELPLSISIGFATREDLNTSLQEVFRKADNNMYREKLRSKQSARSAIVQTLMKALEARDFITEGHAERLTHLAVTIGEHIGLGKQRSNDLMLLAQFHDIGKVGIPDRILFKPSKLDEDEQQEMQRHCEIGHRIALAAPDLAHIADWILKHQEWWDGRGYPLGIKGEEIPLECRILAIVDAFDAMTSDRPYRKAMKHQEALKEIIRCQATQFDPELVDRFIETQNKRKPGQNKKPAGIGQQVVRPDQQPKKRRASDRVVK